MSSKSHFFNRRLRLLADYQFNNNLIDDANGYNLVGTDITYNNGNAVFNGSSSRASRTDTNDIFSFTDGVKDLPFRIETSVKFDVFNKVQFLLAKRQSNTTFCEWQLNSNNSDNSINIVLFSEGANNNRIVKGCVITPNTNTIYNIVVTYDGNGLDGLNININGVDGTLADELGTYVKMIKTNSDFTVGNFTISSATRFNGQIDYLKIYK